MKKIDRVNGRKEKKKWGVLISLSLIHISLGINIYGNQDMQLFEAGVKYFR